ncbi:hypothetical protein M3Y94_00986500 [Aphelenchoides besseyi]|nr:hypothetical protein M3Y94_00986500 [Aphelenchoides besseyi]
MFENAQIYDPPIDKADWSYKGWRLWTVLGSIAAGLFDCRYDHHVRGHQSAQEQKEIAIRRRLPNGEQIKHRKVHCQIEKHLEKEQVEVSGEISSEGRGQKRVAENFRLASRVHNRSHRHDARSLRCSKCANSSSPPNASNDRSSTRRLQSMEYKALQSLRCP